VIFTETELSGAFLVEPDRKRDDRGFFARVWDGDLLRRNGLNDALAQASTAYNDRRSTLRGLHFQRPPHEEAKLVRCTRGAVHDVIVDLRTRSPTFRRWLGVELSADTGLMLYVPEGCAHGYLTLDDGSETSYFISTAYASDAAAGVRWDDPAFGIEWPEQPQVISERDRSWPDFRS
jgi:dTDP-4-dehydrorhamnose 3,5-epimerase